MMRQFRIHRVAAQAASALLLIALLPGVAHAHAQLDKPTPADKATVTQPVTVVSGTFVERVNPDGSKLVVKLVGGGTVAQGGVDPGNAKQMVATPATPLGSGAYLVEWTTISLDDGELARGTWTFTVAVTPTASPTPVTTATPVASATVAPSVAPSPTPSTAYAPTSAGPTPVPSAGGDTTGSGSDVVVPILVALIVLGAGAAYLLSRRNRPTTST